MAKLIKITLLLLAVFPLWVTIVAFAEEDSRVEKWRSAINQYLLDNAEEKRRLQVTEILATNEFAGLSDELLESQVKVDISKVNSRGISQIGLRYFDEEGRLVSHTYLKVKLFVQYSVPVAARDLARGVMLGYGDFEIKWIDAKMLRKGVAQPAQILGRQMRTFVPTGKVLYRTAVKTETLVNKGDRVSIHVRARGISISSFGVAQQNGSEGETIKIMSLDSKKEIYAVVTGPKTAEVKL
jgi:flagella basal body P-ring formation protein FlgA